MTTLTLDEHTAAAEKILLDDGSKTYGVLLKNIGCDTLNSTSSLSDPIRAELNMVLACV